MKVYTLDMNLNRHYLEVPKDMIKKKYTEKELQALCLYLKHEYGRGGYYIENIHVEGLKGTEVTVSVYSDSINYFTGLC